MLQELLTAEFDVFTVPAATFPWEKTHGKKLRKTWKKMEKIRRNHGQTMGRMVI